MRIKFLVESISSRGSKQQLTHLSGGQADRFQRLTATVRVVVIFSGSS